MENKTYNNIDIDINPDYTMMKKQKNGLFLSQEQVEILEENNIDYNKCKTLQELIYTIEQYIDDNNYDVLNNLLDVLQERNYYQNYK
jgi:hypothetical protein